MATPSDKTRGYRGREITGEQIAFIRQLIQDRPELSRWKLSRALCEAWQSVAEVQKLEPA